MCVGTVVRKGMLPKCMRDPQNLNPMDESGSVCEHNEYHLVRVTVRVRVRVRV